MFTIKAYSPEGHLNIYEAVELRLAPDKQYLEFIRPNSELVECLLVNGQDFSVVYIENQTGKTVESLRSKEPPERVS